MKTTLIGDQLLSVMHFKTKHLINLLFVLLTMNSCKENDFDVVNLNGNRVSPVGHGGMGADNIYPKNCFESIMNCFYLGAEGTELDIQMTKDSVLVIFHDTNLSHSTDKSGEIWNMNWSEIEGARYKFPLITNYKVITLEMLLQNMSDVDSKLLFMDFKQKNPNPSTSLNSCIFEAFTRLIDKYETAQNIQMEIGGGEVELFELFHNNRPNIPLFIYTQDLDEGIEVGLKYNAKGIVTPSSSISASAVNKVHQNLLMIAVYGIHTKEGNIQMIENNVDFIQTDKLKHLLRILK
jgi:glycerophosphoryl diester phosphodiesterase